MGRGEFILAAQCDLIISISFEFEQESLKDVLIQHYENFTKEFADGGLGQCGGPKILLPSTVEILGEQKIIPGKFDFDCELSFSNLESQLKKIGELFKDIDPKPRLTVTLHDRDSHSRIRLYPHNDVESYLSGF
jgi:hypothetical protein